MRIFETNIGRACFTAGFLAFGGQLALADEGGISFWLPGQFGSLAAAPQVPGWSFANIYYHTSVSAGGDVAAARQITIGRFAPTVNVNLNANLDARVNLALLNATYVVATPVLGGQLALGMTGLFGHNKTSIEGTLTAAIGPITITRQGSISDERWGVGDLYPMATLRWNQGVNNYMVYLTGDIPVGTYSSDRLATSELGTERSTAGSDTPISTRRPAMNSRR